MREAGERVAEGEEEDGWHDEAEAVHRDVVVDTVQEEVQRQRVRVIRQVVVQVEEEAVHDVFDERPEQVAEDCAGQRASCREDDARKDGTAAATEPAGCDSDRYMSHVATGSHTSGTTHHTVRVNPSSTAGPNNRGESGR